MRARICALVAVAVVFALAGCDTGGTDVCDDCNVIPVERLIPLDSHPDWGPDGRTIAYTHWPQTAEERALPSDLLRQVWLLDVETGERRYLTAGWLPAWSPDGARLAFVRGNDIHTVDLSTGTVERLTEWGNCFHPTWSPDGTKVAFDTNHDDPNPGGPEFDVWIMADDGSEKAKVGSRGRVEEWRMPTWHPDGKELAFVIDPWGSPAPPDGLRRLKLGGHEPVMITDGGGWQDANPAWSPDAERIAWTAYEEGRENPKSGVYIISASGTNRRQLTRGGQAPSWSPDGTRIAFFDTYSDAARADSLVEALFVVNADGSGRRRLTHLDDYRR